MIEGLQLVINGTNSSRSRLNESSNLINWAFNQTSQQTLVEKDQFIKEVDVWLGSESSINMISAQKLVSTLSFDQIQLMNSSIEYTKPISAPIKKR
jgi:D-alanyl-D-alanine carboxypeptidase